MFQPHDSEETRQQIESMRSLMEAIILALVDSQGDVAVTASPGASGTVLIIRAAPSDVGKIIGKQGRTARSLRTILSASSMKVGHSFSLDVREEC